MDSSPTTVGHCGVTPNTAGDCERDDLGSWDGPQTPSLERCAQRCSACTRCAFVSFRKGSRPSENSCSWYARCDEPGQHLFKGKEFRTQQVRPLPLLQVAPPPPPPFWGVSFGTSHSRGYCQLMGTDLGDCERGSQGGWDGVSSPSECEARCRKCPRCAYVSVTLAEFSRYPDEGRDRSRRHPPHFWTCRWFARCDMGDLRASLPHAPSHQYVTKYVKPAARARAVEAPAHRQRSVRLAIATTFYTRNLVQEWHKNTFNPVSFVCMLGQWCENARRLRRVLPSDWVVRRIVLVAAAPQPDDVFNTTQRVADMCGASVVYAKAQLLRAILRCKAFGTTGGMQERFLVNWQMFSWTRFDAVLKVDLDVEVAPLAEYDLLRAGVEWRAALRSFLGAPSAKFIAVPDHSAPVNGGLWWGKPDKACTPFG